MGLWRFNRPTQWTKLNFHIFIIASNTVIYLSKNIIICLYESTVWWITLVHYTYRLPREDLPIELSPGIINIS